MFCRSYSRCRIIGVRKWGLFMFIVLIAGTILAIALAPATGEWFLPIYFGLLSLIPLGAFFMGRKYHKEREAKMSLPNPPMYDEATSVCPSCHQHLPSQTSNCIYCGYNLQGETKVHRTVGESLLCSFCGAKNSAVSKFCTVCGSEVKKK